MPPSSHECPSVSGDGDRRDGIAPPTGLIESFSGERLLIGSCSTLSAQNNIKAGQQQLNFGGGQFSETFSKNRRIERNDLRNVSHDTTEIAGDRRCSAGTHGEH